MDKYFVYCDESRHTSRNDKYMVIGGLWVKSEARDSLNNLLKEIKRENESFAEMKWSKISNKYLSFYESYVSPFFDSDDLKFRCIVVDKSKIDYNKYHENDRELGFYKFYYEMLEKWVVGGIYTILLDFQANRGKSRHVILRDCLRNKHRDVSVINEINLIDSEKSNIAQLCDIFTGAVSAGYNGLNPGGAKERMIRYITVSLGWEELAKATDREEDKFNIFEIQLGD